MMKTVEFDQRGGGKVCIEPRNIIVVRDHDGYVVVGQQMFGKSRFGWEEPTTTVFHYMIEGLSATEVNARLRAAADEWSRELMGRGAAYYRGKREVELEETQPSVDNWGIPI